MNNSYNLNTINFNSSTFPNIQKAQGCKFMQAFCNINNICEFVNEALDLENCYIDEKNKLIEEEKSK